MRHRPRSRIVRWCVTLALVLALDTACASTTPTSADGRIVVDVWLAQFPFPGYLDSRERAAAAFNQAHPEYDVRVRAVDFSMLPKEVHEAAMAGHPPAVANYYYNASRIAMDAKAEDGSPLFTSVQKAVSGRTEILGEPVVIDDLIAPARFAYTVDGDLMSMPSTVNTTMDFANQSLLTAAGITSMPTTWAELEKDCAAIRALPKAPPNCVTWPNHSWFFQQAISQQGADLADHDNGRAGRAAAVSETSPELMAYVGWWQKLARNGDYLYTGKPDDFEGTYGAFAGGQVAFFFSTADQAIGLQNAGAMAGFPVTAGRLPVNGAMPGSGNIISGDSLWLTAGLHRQVEDGALAFMQYLDNPENAIDWHLSTKYLPVTYAAISRLQSQGHFDEYPAAMTALQQIHRTNGTPSASNAVIGDFSGVEDTLTAAMADVLTRGADPAGRFAQADRDADALLDRYNAACTGTDKAAAECLQVGMWG